MVLCILINYGKYNYHCTHMILNWSPATKIFFVQTCLLNIFRKLFSYLLACGCWSYFLSFYWFKSSNGRLELRWQWVKGTLCYHNTASYLNSNISHLVTKLLGCCLWVGMDLKAFWSMEKEKFEVELHLKVGRQVKRGLLSRKYWNIK